MKSDSLVPSSGCSGSRAAPFDRVDFVYEALLLRHSHCAHPDVLHAPEGLGLDHSPPKSGRPSARLALLVLEDPRNLGAGNPLQDLGWAGKARRGMGQVSFRGIYAFEAAPNHSFADMAPLVIPFPWFPAIRILNITSVALRQRVPRHPTRPDLETEYARAHSISMVASTLVKLRTHRNPGLLKSAPSRPDQRFQVAGPSQDPIGLLSPRRESSARWSMQVSGLENPSAVDVASPSPETRDHEGVRPPGSDTEIDLQRA
ncbi:hypothetical protein OE88DRAFT_1729392 [Heliocybe sulcata]|uniref:Uncharacterized protein n=1 Tax=Heliocybe sulcata TaxID=5364 RepID=A0A5C3MWQ1_9AGAM|nr:hypothetical protein OE88DRAFT_1729392 [Heliocybe sulcata]